MISKKIKSAIIAASIAQVLSYALLFLLTFFVRNGDDPEAMFRIFGVVAMLVGGGLAGLLAVMMYRERQFIIPAMGGGMYLLIHILVSLLFTNADNHGFAFFVLCSVGIMSAAIGLGYLAMPSGRASAGKARRHAMVQYKKGGVQRR
ncbi:MAG: DUF3792 family protein [Oscillospiraceae bacterium]|nr:DUF3792 family protein [Oscillospiraceae bacterium]